MIHPQSFGLRRRLGPGALVLVGGEESGLAEEGPGRGNTAASSTKKRLQLGPEWTTLSGTLAQTHSLSPTLPILSVASSVRGKKRRRQSHRGRRCVRWVAVRNRNGHEKGDQAVELGSGRPCRPPLHPAGGPESSRALANKGVSIANGSGSGLAALVLRRD